MLELHNPKSVSEKAVPDYKFFEQQQVCFCIESMFHKVMFLEKGKLDPIRTRPDHKLKILVTTYNAGACAF